MMRFLCLAIGLLSAASAALAADPPMSLDPINGPLTWGPCPEGFTGDCRIAVVHGAPDKPNADMVLKVGPGFKFRRHHHSSAERMILLQGRMRVAYDGHDPITLESGHYAYGPAGLPHDASCESAEPCVLFIAFEQPVDAILTDASSR